MKAFIDDRLANTPSVEFFQPIKKLKLKTFSSMKKTTRATVKDKTVPIKSHSNIFGQLALVMQTRCIDLKNVFQYPLGPYPWSLCGSMGELKKTNKSVLMHFLEKDVDPDGMTAVQKIKASGKTFSQFSEQLFNTTLALGKSSKRIDVVFDVYKEESIKNAERLRRGKETYYFIP